MQVAMDMLERRRSARLDRERLALAQQVEAEYAQQQLQQQSPRALEPPGSGRLHRLGSVYLPATPGGARADLRVAQRVLQTIYELYRRYDRQHLIENASFVVAASGIALVVLDNAYVDSEGGKLALRSLNAALTLVLLALVAWRFAVVREILIQRNVVPAHVALHRMPARRLLQLVLELAVCAVCVPPGLGTDATFRVWEWKFYVDSTRGASACVAPYVVHSGGCYLAYTYPVEVLGLLSLLRLYMVPRVIRNLSEFSSYRTSYLGALHRVDTMSSLFAVKCFLHAHPLSFLLAAFLGTLLVTAYTLAIIEGPSNPSVAPIWNALWLVVVTMGTIGYGDVTPVTMAGEVLLVIGGMLAGILLVGALSAVLFGFLALNERDKRFVQLLREQESSGRLRDACVRSIQTAWHRYRACCHCENGQATKADKTAVRSYSNQLYQRTAHQRKLRRRHLGYAWTSAASELRDCQEQLLFSLRTEHSAAMKRLHQMEVRLDALLQLAGDANSKH